MKARFVPFLVFICCFVVSCSKNEETNIETVKREKEIKRTDSSNPLSIGEQHNEILNDIYTDYLSTIQEEIPIAEIHSDVKSIALESLSLFIPEEELDNENWIEIFNDSYNEYSPDNEFPALDNLSSELQIEIQKLYEIVDTLVTSTNIEAGHQIFNITRNALNNPPENLNTRDLLAWEKAVDVLGYSAKYWFDNIKYWEVAIEKAKGYDVEPNGWLGRVWKKIKKVVIADAAGAASGAATGYIKGGTWASAGVGALTGGVGASVGAGVKELAD